MDYPKSVPGVGLVGGKFVDENPATGQQGSLIPSGWGNQVTDELLAVIAAAGLEPSEEQSDQVLQALLEMQKKLSADRGMVVLGAVGALNWPVPDILKSGQKKAKVTVEGGGGGAGGHKNGGGGGGGGGKAIKLVDLTGVDSVLVTIGAGGSGAPAGTVIANGSPGGTSSFGSYCSATGGAGAQSWFPGESGIGIGGDVNSGNGAGTAMVLHGVSQAPAATSTGGNGGGPNGGTASGSASIVAGRTGGVASGGGGGSANGTNYGPGGPGGPGQVVIEW